VGIHRLKRLAALGACLALAAACSEPRVQRVGLARAEIRPAPGVASAPPRFEAADEVEQLDSPGGFFRVHYTRSGPNAVPLTDRDGDGTPDYVATVARDFDAVLAFYAELGYRRPVRDGEISGDHGGDDRFDVYLLDFPNSADGAYRADDGCDAANSCSGYMLLENDFDGRRYPSLDHAVRLVASHELFHAVQAAYAADASGILHEGTAVWASEAFEAQTGDLEYQAPAYLKQPERSLSQETQGTFDAFTYGSALFFQFLSEREGRDVVRELWERIAADGGESKAWLAALDAVLQAHDSSLADAFAELVVWNLYTGERADPDRGYARGAALPELTERKVEPGFSEDMLRVFPLATRYYALDSRTAQTLSAAALNEPSDALGLLLAREHAGRIELVQRAQRSGPSLTASLELAAGDVLHVAVYNTNAAGSSLRPDLCIGTPQDVASCRAAHGDTTAQPATRDSGGCSAVHGHTRPCVGLLWLLIPLAAVARSRVVRRCTKLSQAPSA